MLYHLPANSNKKIATEYVYSKCLSDEEIKKIIESLNPDNWQDAQVYQNHESGKIDETRRILKLQSLIPNNQDGFPLPQITHQISNINNNFWNFDISYINFLEDGPAVFKYSIGGKFTWHIDFTSASANRKLSYSIQLSDTNDYEGGDLEFFDGDDTGKKEKDPQLREKGNIIVFPTYSWHRITPITKGIRYAIVGWVHGPTYR